MTRDEIEVLPADEPKPIKLGWVVREYVGSEVVRLDAPETPLTAFEDLKEGDEVVAYGCVRLTVKTSDDGELYGDTPSTVYMLEFDADDRHCWVTTCAINKRSSWPRPTKT